MVSAGWTNREISRQLAYSVSTMKADVAKILRTLDLENRTQITRYLTEQPDLDESVDVELH
jgi:DNA-binding NarL/FixJ family response regulator